MNFKTTLLDDRLNAVLIAVALVLALIGDADGLFQTAEAGAVTVATAMVPVTIV